MTPHSRTVLSLCALLACSFTTATATAESDSGKAAATPHKSAIKPLSSALHIVEPLASRTPNSAPINPDALWAFEKTIHGFETVTVSAAVTTRTSSSNNIVQTFKYPQSITIQGHAYKTQWRPAKDQVGGTYLITFGVAGLDLNSVIYKAGTSRGVPIRYYIESHPRIRARVMHEQGADASVVAAKMISEYHLDGQDTTQVLFDETFPVVDIGRALQHLYSATAQDTANWSHAAGMPSTNTAQMLSVVYELGAVDTARTLRLASYDFNDVYTALKVVFNLVREEGEDALVAAGFSAEDAFKAILPDLLTFYDNVIRTNGPVVALHPNERFKMSSIDWFLQQVSLEYEIGGVAYVYNDPTNPINSTNLGVIAESLKAQGATNLWLGSIDQFTDALKAGNQDGSKAHVHVIRLRDLGVTDLQFWLWYPYNGPGTFHVRATIKTFYDDTVWEDGQHQPDDYGNTAPLAEHYSDWENVIVRTETKTGKLLGVFMSEHGDYPWFTTANGLSLDAAGHVKAFASLNGHANYPTESDNHTEVKSAGYEDLKGFFSFELVADLRNYTAASSTVLNAWSDYQIDGIDQYFMNPSRQISSNPWISFEGKWGPANPLNLNNSQKVGIVKNIAGDAITQVRKDIPKLAAEGCSVVATPCLLLYPACFAGCMVGLVAGAEIALDPLLDKYGPGMVDNFPADDQVLDGKPTPGVKSRGTEWYYLRYPTESPALVRVAPLNDPAAGIVPVMVTVSQAIASPVPSSYDVSIQKAELAINGSFIDITGSPASDGSGYIYNWDTRAVLDGTYDLHARLTDTAGKTYEYSWDVVTVHVANGHLILDPLAINPTRIVEGGTVTVKGTYYSPTTNMIDASLDWGDGTVEQMSLDPAVRQFNMNHTYSQDSPNGYQIVVNLGGGVKRTADLLVDNRPPVVTDLVELNNLLPLSSGTALATVNGAFSDPGLLDTHSAVWDWGDGTSTTQGNVWSPITGTHRYPGPGVFGIGLDVIDSGHATGSSNLFSYITAYNPGKRYFAGSGSIITPMPKADGSQIIIRAPFGFVLHPDQGTFVFRLRLGDTEFYSDHYDNWTTNGVHTGGSITGTGTLNGTTYTNGVPYDFVLTATKTTFEFQISTPVTNSVPYATPSNAGLASGNIIYRE